MLQRYDSYYSRIHRHVSVLAQLQQLTECRETGLSFFPPLSLSIALGRHQGLEFFKGDFSVAIGIDFIHHGINFSFRQCLS